MRTPAWWRQILNGPRIDWQALVEAKYAPKKTPRHLVAKATRNRMRNQKLKKQAAKRAANARKDAERHERWKATTHVSALSLAHRMAAAMDPGEWYGLPDLRRRCDVNRHAQKQIIVRMRDAGVVEQAINEAWTPDSELYRKGVAVQWVAKGREPMRLFRLTDKGLEFRRMALMLQ